MKNSENKVKFLKKKKKKKKKSMFSELRGKSQNCKIQTCICEKKSQNCEFFSLYNLQLWVYIRQFWERSQNCEIIRNYLFYFLFRVGKGLLYNTQFKMWWKLHWWKIKSWFSGKKRKKLIMYIYTNGHVIAKSLQKCFFIFFKHTTDFNFFFIIYCM